MRRLIVLVLVAACGGSQAGRAGNGDVSSFAKGFYSEENIANYIATVDALILEATQRRFSGPRALVEGTPIMGDTANGIRIVMTVMDTEMGAVHHVSFSRPPYLATPFARFIAGLVAKRGAYPVPDAIMRSQRGIYHVEWQVPHGARGPLTNARKAAMKSSDPMKVAAAVLTATFEMRIVEFEVPRP